MKRALNGIYNKFIFFVLNFFHQSNNISSDEEQWYTQIRDNVKYENVMEFYPLLDTNPKIRWKESIQKLILQNQ